jgi:activating signal cointegrator complex subunit 3
MEGFLASFSPPSQKDETYADVSADVTAALQALSHALEAALTIASVSSSSPSFPTQRDAITADWLLQKCTLQDSFLTPQQLAMSIWETAHLENEMQQQEALFQLLGEQNFDLLLELTPQLPQIAKIARHSIEAAVNSAAPTTPSDPEVFVDVEEERRIYLREQAAQAARTASLAKAELEALMTVTSGATHAAISKKQEKQARKFAEKAQKQAAAALQQAKDAGAILDEDDWLAVSSTGWGEGGLVNQDAASLIAFQQSLLPEGTKEYYEMKGLPADAEYFEDDNMKRVLIPAIPRDTAKLRSRLKIVDVITDPREAAPFYGTTSLNPMQSTVFERAFHSRDNLLICAPTGAGKTNVALLTVVAHFRDVGLLNAPGRMDTGHKVVYIAPMKALAQEVVEKFSSKLKPFIVRELTGDMQLTRAEADSAQVIVTTPEKWDVVTRKSGTDESSLGNQCGLLIIDEVHLLADERGAVVESVVARLHRLVESRQKQVRIVALSATLPNYGDVADFLQVPSSGVFFFGPEHRPVPLQQQFIGVGTKKMPRDVREQKMNELCFDAVLDSLKRGYQVMVFVHSRKGTGDTARALAEQASSEGLLDKYFVNEEKAKHYAARVQKSRNRQVTQFFEQGLGIHHAGMLRGDRKLTEQMFFDGAIQVLCCTATLAWGVNLPAHTVVIKGTDVYNPEKGGNVDLSILDVQQIFGRAGRPQFDSSGEAILITSLDAFPRYMDKLVRPIPIESNFSKQLADHLNAEIAGRTVTTITEAATWLTYTYMYVRMGKNPLQYGMRPDDGSDPLAIREHCLSLVTEAAKLLEANKMISFHAMSGNLSVKDKGHVAAHYYIQAESIEVFNERFSRSMVPTDSDLCRTICLANEFNNLKLRPEEVEELQAVAQKIPLKIIAPGADEIGRSLIVDAADKAFVLLQAFITRERIKSFTLISDMNYIESNAARIARALFEMSKRESRATTTVKMLRIAKSIEKQLWWFQTPLRVFEDEIQAHVFSALENYISNRSYDAFEATLSLMELQASEVGQICKSRNIGGKVQRLISMLPRLELTCNIHPVTRAVLRMHVTIEADFNWSKRWHGATESFWIMVEDPDADRTYHAELITLQFRTYQDPIQLEIWIPAFDKLPDQYTVRAISDSWVGVEQILPVLLHGKPKRLYGNGTWYPKQILTISPRRAISGISRFKNRRT